MPQAGYVSTDPNFGLAAPPATPRYISTDPNFGRAPDFRTTNEPPSAALRLAASAYQASPFNLPAAFDLLKRFEANPEPVIKEFLAGQGHQFAKAWDDLKSNRPFSAVTHVLYGLTPGIGPALDAAGDQDAAGDRAGAIGTVIGALSNLAVPEAIGRVAMRLPSVGPRTVAGAAAVRFGQERSIPIDAATASDNFAVKGAQALADRSLAGSVVATPARARQTAAMTRVGEELATETHPTPTTPELAGTGLREALTQKVAGHTAAANEAYDTIRQLEQARVTSEEMGFPVNLQTPKKVIQPLYDQMKRQMPVTQQQSSVGLKAIENILEAPDWAPLSQVDRDLSAIKALARTHGGLAKFAVRELSKAVDEAAAHGGPDIVTALQRGRAATIAKYATTDVLDALKAEPVKTIQTLTTPKDAAIGALRTVAEHVPEQVPIIARAYLEDLLMKSQKAADWFKLGRETKAVLFPEPGHLAALDNFFVLTDRMSRANINPSGSGYAVSLAAQGGALGTGLVLLVTNPPVGAAVLGVEGLTQIGGASLAKLLRSPAAVKAMTNGLRLSFARAAPAAQAAAAARILSLAKESDVPLALPLAAQGPAPTESENGR